MLRNFLDQRRILGIQIDEHRDLGLQNLRNQRLDDIVHRPHFVTAEHRTKIITGARDKDDRGVPRALAFPYQARRFEAVDARHARIQQDDRKIIL